MRLILLAFVVLALTGCPGGRVKPTLPAATVIEKPVKVFVPISDDLLAKCPWPKSAKPSEALEIARKRRQCLEQYERNLDAIGKVRGNPVP